MLKTATVRVAAVAPAAKRVLVEKLARAVKPVRAA
jgi:hypothetical protein